MRTFRLRNGDFVVGAGGFEEITGTQKVYQDLSVLVREPLGDDRFHPQWGGILDEFVGFPFTEDVEGEVRNEVNRLVQNYVVMQSNQISADISLGRKPRYTPEEIVVGIDGIQVQQFNDRVNVRVFIRTASGDPVDIIRTVGF
jgi:hypothetical protein